MCPVMKQYTKAVPGDLYASEFVIGVTGSEAFVFLPLRMWAMRILLRSSWFPHNTVKKNDKSGSAEPLFLLHSSYIAQRHT